MSDDEERQAKRNRECLRVYESILELKLPGYETLMALAFGYATGDDKIASQLDNAAAEIKRNMGK